MDALGKLVSTLDGASGAYLLGDDATMMQDSFRKLATNVVMPLAEEIHREDRIIPPEILEPLTEMGCFGPVSYTHLDVYKRQDQHRFARLVGDAAQRTG